MSSVEEKEKKAGAVFMSAEEVARYLEVDPSVVADWASKGRIPAIKEADTWKIDRKKLDAWIADGKMK